MVVLEIVQERIFSQHLTKMDMDLSNDIGVEVNEPMMDRLQYIDIIGAVNLRAGQPG